MYNMIGVNISQILFCIGLLLVHSNSLIQKTFRCDNGKYIADSAFCNTFDNCRDGTDESQGCDWYHCDFGKFKCGSGGSCKNVNVRCNTHKDCPDGSDEANCGDEINVHNCSLPDGKFLCHDGLRCLDLEYTCDGNCNCFDCSDEDSNCSKIDDYLLSECPHSYFPTPNGPECLCNSSNKEFSKLCEEIKNCANENICQQRCSKYKDKVQCSCYDDYDEIPGSNGFKCRSKVYYGNSLVYSTSSQIKFLNLSNNEVSVIKNNLECAVLTAAHNDVYYVTYNDERIIFKTSISSKTTTEVVKSDSPIISIAVDYITNNTYFTTNTSLSVCSNDGKICTQLKCCNISYVAVAPNFGLMFYTTKSSYQGERFIVKSNLDGSDENLLVDGTFRNPGPLTVEESIKKLYWLEVTDSVLYSVSFSGDDTEIQTLKFHGSVISLTAIGSTLYFTKSRDNEIYSLENIEQFTKHVSNGTRLAMMSPLGMIPISATEFRIPLEMLTDLNATRIYDNNLTLAIRNVHAFNPLLQSAKQDKNPCETSSCSGLRLIRPTSSSLNRLDHSCKCDNFTPTDTPHWCNISNQQSPLRFSAPIKDAVISEKPTQSSGNMILTTIYLIVGIVLVLSVAHFVFRKWNCYGYYDIIQNCTNKHNDRIDIYNGEDL